MARSLAQILKEADDIIEKKASASKAAVVVPSSIPEDDDIFKLAEAVRHSNIEKTASEVTDFTYFEKLANSLAVLEVILSGKELDKMSQLEKTAQEKNIPATIINETLEKYAEGNGAGQKVYDFIMGSADSFRNIINAVPGKLHPNKAIAAGQVVGAASPFLAAAGLGAYGGAKLKERQIKSQYGIQ